MKPDMRIVISGRQGIGKSEIARRVVALIHSRIGYSVRFEEEDILLMRRDSLLVSVETTNEEPKP